MAMVTGPRTAETPPRPRLTARGEGVASLLVALFLATAIGAATPATAAPPPLSLELRLDRPLVHVAPPPADPGENQQLRRAYVRVRIAAIRDASAAPLNLALVVDRVAGVETVRAAATEALGGLSDRDLVSVLAYDDTIEVVAPPAAAGELGDALARLGETAARDPGRAHGPANLFAAVSKAAAELRGHSGPARVSHIVVLAARPPGLGPQRASDLSELGAKLYKDGLGVSVVSLGAGPDDTLRALARGGHGHFMAIDSDARASGALAELVERLRSVRARSLRIAVVFDGATPPLRVIGGFGELTRSPSRRLVSAWTELGSSDALELFAELDVRRCEPGVHAFASAELNYFDVHLNRAITVNAPLTGECRVGDPGMADVDYDVAASVAIAIAEEARERARLALADGRRDAAARALEAALAELRGPLLAERHPDILAIADELEAELGGLGSMTGATP